MDVGKFLQKFDEFDDVDDVEKDKGSTTSNLDAQSTTSTSASKTNTAKTIWCQTQWTNLSLQAKNLGLPKLPYFDLKTMLLSKEVNAKLWKQLVSAARVATAGRYRSVLLT